MQESKRIKARTRRRRDIWKKAVRGTREREEVPPKHVKKEDPGLRVWLLDCNRGPPFFPFFYSN